MILLVKTGGEASLPDWKTHFATFAPHLDVRWWTDPEVEPADVRYCLVYQPDFGRLAQFPNLRLICSAAAGVDHITSDPQLPQHLQILRMATGETGQRMGEYVCWAVLSLLRDARRMSDAQAARQWDNFEVLRSAWDTRIGILGMGNLGSATAAMLRNLGFATAGWSRSPKTIPGIESFSGDEGLPAFLARTDIAICLLPSTPATQNILSARTFALMPKGAAVVNAGRGTHVALPDLIAALDSGHLSGAVLDVFDPEPLPADNPVWTHPKIILTPHVASLASRRERVRYVAESIAAFERGETLPNMYQPERGY